MQATGAEAATFVDQNPPVAMTRLDDSDPTLMQELLETVSRVAQSASFTLGPEVLAFEAEFAAYCGTEHAIGVSCGTDALALTLRALRIGAGDEVLVPANTFIGTAEAVSMAGAVPRFVDVNAHTGLVTVDGILEALGPRTRGVIPVHLYGRTLDLESIMELARDHGVAVVEDACQAHGAWAGSRRAGAIGDAGCFSFYPAKNLGAWGDAGAVVTDDPVLADRVRLIRAHGERIRYHHEVVGTTARMDAIQAAILRVKLRRLDGWNASRQRAGAALDAALHGAPVTVVSPSLLADNVFHQFVVQSADRDGLRAHLATRGIATAIHYPIPIHQTAAYAAALRHPLPVSEDLAQQIISLPMHPGITDEEIARTAQAVHEFAP